MSYDVSSENENMKANVGFLQGIRTYQRWKMSLETVTVRLSSNKKLFFQVFFSWIRPTLQCFSMSYVA